MQFSLSHLTYYQYSESVSESVNDVRLCPVSDDFQICHYFDLKINPPCRVIMRQLDFYINQVQHFEIIQPHQSLSVEAISTVETFEDIRNFSVFSDPQSLTDLKFSERYYDFLSPSERVHILPMVIHDSREIFPNGFGDVQSAVLTIMQFIYDGFVYDPQATAVETQFQEMYLGRRGVCQDFAHAMLALCRSIQIPARYVSGYFYLDQKDETTKVDNAQSHAWVECFLPGIGWVGYDPTHNRRVDATYIKVAIGRDYSDVRPLSGTFRGAVTAQLEVKVQVNQLDGDFVLSQS